jgi:ferritin-like metal-binding protein YciE
MSDKLANPRDLLLQQLSEMLWVERMLVFDVLPSLHKSVKSESLAEAVEEHLRETHGHVARVEQAFHALGVEPSSARDGSAEALKKDHDETAGKITDPRLEDVFHASAAMLTEHHEIGSYDAMIELARALGRGDVEDPLTRNRREEEAALEKLEKISERLRKELTD